ncbi:hypothetical protein ACFL4G_08225 [Thermodesulfobacteriota bacterium]
MQRVEGKAVDKKSTLRWIWEYFIPILMGLYIVEMIVFFTVFWEHPEFGFSHFGPTLYLTLLFPLLWLAIYVLCGAIAKRRGTS